MIFFFYTVYPDRAVGRSEFDGVMKNIPENDHQVIFIRIDQQGGRFIFDPDVFLSAIG
ncbi:hypothetical protein FQZ97_1163250 [compost metagenome]